MHLLQSSLYGVVEPSLPCIVLEYEAEIVCVYATPSCLDVPVTNECWVLNTNYKTCHMRLATGANQDAV